MKQLPASAKLNDANFSRVYRHITVDPDVTVSDLLRPGFWIHHGGHLSRFDLLDVMASDGSLDVQLRVELIEKGLPWMRVLRQWVREGRAVDAEPGDEPEATAPAGYVVDQEGKGTWRARTRNPVIIVASGLLTKDEAMKAALDHAAKAGADTAPAIEVVPKVSGTAKTPTPETDATRATVEIPGNWRDLSWQDRRSLASKFSPDPIHNGEEANAAIEAELAKRAA